MFCIKCGFELADGVYICENCGADMNDEIRISLNADAEPVTQAVEAEIIDEVKNDCSHPYNTMDYENDIAAKKQLKKARRLSDAAFGTGIAAVGFIILGVVLFPLFWFLWFVAFMLGISSFVLSFLSGRAMYEFAYNDLYAVQIKKIKITYRKGKIAAVISMISAVVGLAAVIFTLHYFVTVLMQSDFTEAVQLLWNLVTDAVSKIF
ncbi:MAG: zinc ribbon domain-containing protein [Clostridia bacterium]|nr:zinc ribbon domain-containing protein [Clostridia bacterium]